MRWWEAAGRGVVVAPAPVAPGPVAPLALSLSLRLPDHWQCLSNDALRLLNGLSLAGWDADHAMIMLRPLAMVVFTGSHNRIRLALFLQYGGWS
jgi:hypothetical protein